MPIKTVLRELDFAAALREVSDGAALIDLRPAEEYLDVHISGSLALVYEFGPGMAARARDCLPLSLPLLLLDLDAGDLLNAADALRGKGFTVVGAVADAINRWAAERGSPVSTEVVTSPEPPEGFLLDVGDPGAESDRAAARIPVERLWRRTGEVVGKERVVVAAGAGVRAALAVGMLERAGAREVMMWKR